MPAVAATSTGLPSSTPFSSTSKKVLNRPEYDAENTGVTTIRPSASAYRVDGRGQLGAGGNPVSRWSVSSWARSRSSMWVTSTSSRASTVAAVSRSASSRVDEGAGESGGDDDEARSCRHLLAVLGAVPVAESASA